MEEIKKKIVARMQGNIPLEKEPFKRIAEELGIEEKTLLDKLEEMKEEGFLRRVGAILRHRQVGFEANAMVAWKVPEEKVVEIGEIMASFKEASHVYERPAHPEWPYNIYTMIHSTTKEECENIIEEMSRLSGIKDYKRLYSIKEYKKTSMQYFIRVENYKKCKEGRFIMKDENSRKMFEKAVEMIPGGVNSPARSFGSVGRAPLFLKEGRGSKVIDEDDNEYIDYVASYGPLILGHTYPRVKEALHSQVDKGTGFGSPTELENEMAELVIEAVPSVEVVRMVNSGTEATMSALRLARGYTGRNKIVKLTGCYHGHSDSLLIKAGSGVTTLGLPDSPGVPVSVAETTITAPYNNLQAMEKIFEEHGDDIAGVIIEPVAGNMGVVPPREGYLKGLRELTDKYGALLIFDEVMTGFRVAYGGAQARYGITPDLTCLGKVIGGGLPVGAYGGKKEIMAEIAPSGPIYQAGTLSGNPIAMTAGIETLKVLKEEGTYEKLEEKSSKLEKGLREAVEEAAVPVFMTRVGSMLGMYFTDEEVCDFETAAKADDDLFATYFNKMLEEGIYLAPSQYEAMFTSLVHSDEDIKKTVESARKALKKVKEKL